METYCNETNITSSTDTYETGYKCSTDSSVGFPGWSLLLVAIYMSLLSVIGVIGNGLTILIQSKFKSKFSTDYFIIHMAVVDIICSAFIAPLYVVRNLDTVWITTASSTFCKVHSGLIYLTHMCSVLLLSAIAVDRYFVTCRPIVRYGRNCNSAILIVNVLIAGVSLFFAVVMGITHDLDSVTLDCSLHTTEGYILSGVLSFAFIAFFATSIFCYTKISIALRRQQKLATQSKLKNTNISKHNQPRKNSILEVWCLCCRRNKVIPSTALAAPVSVRNHSVVLQDLTRTTSRCTSNDITAHNSPEMKAEITNQTSTTDPKTLPTFLILRKRNTRVTLTIFILTAVYIFTWVVNWVTTATTPDSELLKGMNYFVRKLFMLNCITNPLVYLLLSTKFRKKAFIMLSCRKQAQSKTN